MTHIQPTQIVNFHYTLTSHKGQREALKIEKKLTLAQNYGHRRQLMDFFLKNFFKGFDA